MDDQINEILYLLDELSQDDTVPRNVKNKVSEVAAILKNNDEISIKKNKAIHKIEELTEDSNVKAYTRSQIWDIQSKLEGL